MSTDDEFRMRVEENQKRIARIAAISGGVIGGLVLLIIISVCICCLVPVCWLSSQSRERRRLSRQLQGGQPPPPYSGQPGGFGQFGGQPMYPSQQQFNIQSSGMTNPSASAFLSNPSTPGAATGSGVPPPPPYPVQQSTSAV